MSVGTNINVNSIRKIVNVKVAGRITEKEEQEFFNDYRAKTKAINPADYTLEVDCTEMKVVTPDMTENLTQVLQMYQSTGFRKIICHVKSAILKSQITRLARNAGVKGVSVIDIG